MVKFLAEAATSTLIGGIVWLVLYVIIGVTLWVSFLAGGVVAAVGILVALAAFLRTRPSHAGSRQPIGAH